MTLPRPRWRFRLRTLMVAVALVAAGLGTIAAPRDLPGRKSTFLNSCNNCAVMEKYHAMRVAQISKDVANLDRDAAEWRQMTWLWPSDVRWRRQCEERAHSQESLARFHRDRAERERRTADYFGSLREKYDFASRHPWLPVWPDPPEPE